MSSARGRANHALYLARIVLGGWRSALDAQEIPATILAQAYGVGAVGHLVAAYGWFLLEISQAEPLPPRPPGSCDELPPPVAGKVLPGEIHEFRQLETSGWLRDMLAEPFADTSPQVHQAENLAFASAELPGPEEVGQWLARLEAVFDRMGNSLDEY